MHEGLAGNKHIRYECETLRSSNQVLRWIQPQSQHCLSQVRSRTMQQTANVVCQGKLFVSRDRSLLMKDALYLEYTA